MIATDNKIGWTCGHGLGPGAISSHWSLMNRPAQSLQRWATCFCVCTVLRGTSPTDRNDFLKQPISGRPFRYLKTY